MLRSLTDRPLRLPHLSAYVPKPGDPAIFWFNSERDDIVAEVTGRVYDHHAGDVASMEMVLNDACIQEIRRLERQKDQEASDHLGFWKSMVRRIARMSPAEQRHALRGIIERMALDIAGSFDPRVYEMARRLVPKVITGVMRPSQVPRELFSPRSSVVEQLVNIEGDVELLRRLEPKGTLVYVPTHSSNLDSVVLGHALNQAGLAPVVYGAGKNLFTNPMLSFFMHNLGAYRVDRRIQVALYKEVLKTYSQIMVERGYHSLFFPGGTRSRSGLIEAKLKLGLAGSAVEAFTRNAVHGIDRPVWFVPTTINYGLVLEAETLVEDWLMEEGRSRYIIEDDEFSRIDRWLAFFRKLVEQRSACIIHFGTPIDCFGNDVDADGSSLTRSGRAIDPKGYVSRHGKPVIDPVRDAAYTRELAQVLTRRFREDTVLMTTQVVAHVLFRHLVTRTLGSNLFQRLRMRGEVSIGWGSLVAEVEATQRALVELASEGVLRVSPLLRTGEPAALVERTLAVWDGYHSRVVASRHGSQVTLDDPTLLLYYQNRLVPFAEEIARRSAPDHLPSARYLGTLGGPR